MSVWSRISDAVGKLARGGGVAALFDRFSKPPERRVAFTIAVIALGAKMAKADGRVTRDEVTAFRSVFTIPKSSEASAARLFDYARQDVAGFEAYAEQVARMFGRGAPALEDLLHGLFRIAMADGELHPAESAFLERVAAIFGVDSRTVSALRAHYAPDHDPWAVLGLDPGASREEVRKRWRALVRETHPDRMMARGVPEEAVKIATERLARVNAAYEAVTAGG